MRGVGQRLPCLARVVQRLLPFHEALLKMRCVIIRHARHPLQLLDGQRWQTHRGAGTPWPKFAAKAWHGLGATKLLGAWV